MLTVRFWVMFVATPQVELADSARVQLPHWLMITATFKGRYASLPKQRSCNIFQQKKHSWLFWQTQPVIQMSLAASCAYVFPAQPIGSIGN